MVTFQTYFARYSGRFQLPGRLFWRGFFHVFGFEAHPYNKPVSAIFRKDVYTALRSDLEQLRIDSKCAAKDHEEELAALSTKL